MGDMNLCAKKWTEESFKNKVLANEVISTLAQCELVNRDMGLTYLADRLNTDGNTIERGPNL